MSCGTLRRWRTRSVYLSRRSHGATWTSWQDERSVARLPEVGIVKMYSTRHPRRVNTTKLAVLIIVAGMSLAGPFIGCGMLKATRTTHTFTVTDKERVTGDDSKYLVFTNGEVLCVDDTLVFMRFDSSDLYGSLKIGKTYRGDVVGWRVPFLSWYRNILTAREVKT